MSVRYVVCGVIWQDDKILIGLRPPQSHYGSFWELPGGKVEDGESSYDALVRELEEELVIHVTSAHVVYRYQRLADPAIQTAKFYNIHVYNVDSYIGVPQCLAHTEIKFIHPADIPSISNFLQPVQVKHLLRKETQDCC